MSLRTYQIEDRTWALYHNVEFIKRFWPARYKQDTRPLIKQCLADAKKHRDMIAQLNALPDWESSLFFGSFGRW